MTIGPITPTITMPAGSYTTQRDTTFGAGSRNLPVLRVIEDPYPKDSKDSLFIQAVDVCAYFLLQRARPNAFIRRAGAERYLHRLLPVLNKKATTANALGVVLL